MMRRLLLCSLVAVSAIAHSQDPGYSSYDYRKSVFIGGGVSIPMVGSWERRAGGLAGYASLQPEPRLRHFFGGHIDSDWTFYGMYHVGRDGRFEPDPTWAGGFTYGYRKSWADSSGRGLALEAYWGGIWGDRGSRDLPSSVNSTPGVVLSWLRPFGARDLNLNLRYEHMSNGGTYEPNRGENFFLLMFDFKLK